MLNGSNVNATTTLTMAALTTELPSDAEGQEIKSEREEKRKFLKRERERFSC